MLSAGCSRDIVHIRLCADAIEVAVSDTTKIAASTATLVQNRVSMPPVMASLSPFTT